MVVIIIGLKNERNIITKYESQKERERKRESNAYVLQNPIETNMSAEWWLRC